MALSTARSVSNARGRAMAESFLRRGCAYGGDPVVSGRIRTSAEDPRALTAHRENPRSRRRNTVRLWQTDHPQA
nr:hypothetical protein StreXyl84_74580 [Streptomyces sp. Xyl84]